jgi:hypothetical protein
MPEQAEMKLREFMAKGDALARSAESQARLAVPFAILMALFLAFYLGEMSSFTVSIDEESAALRLSPVGWLFQGRWTMYLLETLFPQPIVPYFPLLLFGLACAAGYLMVAASLRRGPAGLAFYVLFPLFSAFPTLFFILDFTGNTLGMAAGLLLSCGSILAFSRSLDRPGSFFSTRRITEAAVQVAIATAAIGCYQSFALLILLGNCGVFLTRLIESRNYSVRYIVSTNLYILLIFVAPILTNQLIFLGAVALWPDEPRAYIETYLRLDLLTQSPLETFSQSLQDYASVYLGSEAVYGFRYLSFPLLIIAGMATLVWMSRHGGMGAAAFVLLYAAGMTYVPFAFHLISGGDLPYRALVAVPMAFWFFASAATSSDWRAMRLVAGGLAAVVALQSLYTLSMFQGSRRLVYQHDVELASQIYDRIAQQADRFDRQRNYAIDVFGAYDFRSIYPSIDGSTWGASFFAWDGGNPVRMVKFMQILGYKNLLLMTQKNRQALLPTMLVMPVWPRDGSVLVIDNKVLVKLGKKPGILHRKLMPEAPVEDAGEMLFDLADAPAASVTVQNTEIISRDAGVLHVAAGDDAMILFSTGKPDKLRDCHELQIRTSIFTREDEKAQIFFMPIGATNFSEANSIILDVKQGNAVEFNLASPTGFEDRLRLDPAYGAAEAAVSSLTVRCGPPSVPR